MSKKLFGMAVLAAGVSFGFAVSTASADDKVKEVMKGFFKGDDAPIKQATSGKASKEDLEALANAIKELSEAQPAKGDLESWKKKTGELLKAATLAAKGDKKGVRALEAASNCKSCHNTHKG